MQTVPVSMLLDQANAAYIIQSTVAEANKIDASALSGHIQNSVTLLYSAGGMLAVQAGSALEQRLKLAQNTATGALPVSMRLNPQAAAFVIQGVMSEANNINGSMFATQIQATVALLYSQGGMIAIQTGSVMEQRLIAAARQANAAQPAPAVPAQPRAPQPPVPPAPPAITHVPVPPPVIPPAYPLTPAQAPADATQGNPEITIAGQPVVDVQVTPLG